MMPVRIELAMTNLRFPSSMMSIGIELDMINLCLCHQ
jgi:hypothetical protein